MNNKPNRPGGRGRPGRYRPGSRTRQRRLAAVGQRRSDFDLQAWGRLVVQAAAEQAALEAEAQAEHEASQGKPEGQGGNHA